MPNEKVTKRTIDLLSKSATELKILNIQNCRNVSLDELVPLGMWFIVSTNAQI
jgi:hypothetical protein